MCNSFMHGERIMVQQHKTLNFETAFLNMGHVGCNVLIKPLFDNRLAECRLTMCQKNVSVVCLDFFLYVPFIMLDIWIVFDCSCL